MSTDRASDKAIDKASRRPSVLRFPTPGRSAPTVAARTPSPVAWSAVRVLKAPKGGAGGGATRMPSWYQTKREDSSQLPPESEFDRNLWEAAGNSVIRALPRRDIDPSRFSSTPLLMQESERFHASFAQTFRRFLLWIGGVLWFQLGIVWDKLRGRDSEQRRAARLLAIINRIGGTLIKVGQQLSMRVDLLPWTYCVELSKLLDRMPHFPFRDAVAAIERATGKPLREVFARFDPDPIGSASIACVYQAVLRTGEKVAVKVRRPGVGAVFAADLRALRWLINVVELLAIVRPGSLQHLGNELESSFMEELDLRREAYFQEIFRRNAQDPKRTRRSYFSSPRIYFDFTSHEVIVNDFVSGMWLWEILAAVEQRDPVGQARMRELNIDPKVVARRLLWIAAWGNLSNVLFHGDPHPANVIVQADNRIIFVDFGACGWQPAERRARIAEFLRAQEMKDVTAMAQAAIGLIEPLPPIDLDEFQRDVERLYFRASAAHWSKHARWWERTSATLWIGLMQLARKYRLPVQDDLIKGLRATLLYDTLAVRLDNDLDVGREQRRFVRDALHVQGKRTRRRLRKRLQNGLGFEDYAKLDELFRFGGKALDQLKRLNERPAFNFAYSIAKPVYAVITVIRVVGLVGALLFGATGAVAAALFVAGQQVSLLGTLRGVLINRGFLALVCVAVAVGLRRIMFRLNDKDRRAE